MGGRHAAPVVKRLPEFDERDRWYVSSTWSIDGWATSLPVMDAAEARRWATIYTEIARSLDETPLPKGSPVMAAS